MYAFIGFFYLFISVYFYKVFFTNNSYPIKVYVNHFENEYEYDDDGDYVMGDDNLNDTLTMYVEKKNKIIIYDMYDYLKEIFISDYSLYLSDGLNTSITFEYVDKLIVEDIKKELVQYINEYVMNDTIILYFNDEIVDIDNFLSDIKKKD